MKSPLKAFIVTATTTACAIAALLSTASAAEEKEDPVKVFMRDYHKAPKGTDPVCKKAADGHASKDELTKLVAGYKMMTTAKPPKGELASWKEKTTKVLAAAEALKAGKADAAAKYKEAVNCKACHSAHKPD